MICNTCNNQMQHGTNEMCQSCFLAYEKANRIEIPEYKTTRLEFFTAAALTGILVNVPHYDARDAALISVRIAKETIKLLDEK